MLQPPLKLIQIPLRVPPLGINEVRAYLTLLFIERSTVSQDRKEQARVEVCRLLGRSWKGEAISPGAVKSLVLACPDHLVKKFELSDRLARLMTTSKRIAGNPRLIKRFLNTLSIRKALAVKQGIEVDEAVLAKVLLLERSASQLRRRWAGEAHDRCAEGEVRDGNVALELWCGTERPVGARLA